MRWSKLLLLSIVVLGSCKSNTTFHSVSFYYWKTTYRLTDYENEYLAGIKPKKIYFKAFDVINAEPNGVLSWQEDINPAYEYVPVVFIDNVIFADLGRDEMDQLVENIYRLLKGICDAQTIEIKEIQIDCDWTKGTKANYFYFLKRIKNITKKLISVTIRLHQIKYKQATGLPPCDYGVLMCYNMGNLKSRIAKNSIYDAHVLDTYLRKVDYELSLKAALPIFDWMLWYRGTRFMGILNKARNLDLVEKVSDPFEAGFKLVMDTTIGDHAFEKGDYIRDETVSQRDLVQAKRYLSNSNLNLSDEIIYFSLDSINLSQYEKSIFTY